MTELVTILNITPDSFSDGGKYDAAVLAAWRIAELQTQGAKIIDIGAESTRPGAVLISEDEEWRRLEPILKLLKNFPDLIFSIDTRHAKTAEKSLDYGVTWINDVSGGNDSEMLKIIKNHKCNYTIMHNLGLPADPKKTLSNDADPIHEITKWAKEKLAEFQNAGINLEKIIFDPGIGFGKTANQSWEIIKRAHEFKKLPVKLLLGHSRKSFLPAPKDIATTAVTSHLAKQKIDYLRVHDFLGNKTALEINDRLNAE